MNEGKNQHKEQVESTYKLKTELEKLRHKNIMEEMEQMKKLGIKKYQR